MIESDLGKTLEGTQVHEPKLMQTDQDANVITFAEALRTERRRMDLTQEELAVRLETSQQNVAAWEAGKSLPRPELQKALVEVFGPHSAIAALPPRGQIPRGVSSLREEASTQGTALQLSVGLVKPIPLPTGMHPAVAQSLACLTAFVATGATQLNLVHAAINLLEAASTTP